MNQFDQKMMRRALQLARLGRPGASPNPMVGAVITDPSGLIVGEGFHRRCGEGHAEVNAVASARSHGADLTQCTVYVTLEPCAHYGRTPPCAKLLADCHVRRVVVGCVDPFSRVQGRGIAMLREASVQVDLIGGELEQQCRELNRIFFTAHTLGRPWVTLKWARTADGMVDAVRASAAEPPLAISTPLNRSLVHRLRSQRDAIAVGSRTAELDRPRLDCRLWPTTVHEPRRVEFNSTEPLAEQLHRLYEDGVTSLLVEGGPTLLRSFLADGLWDEIRVETSDTALARPGVPAPAVPANAREASRFTLGPSTITYHTR